MKLWQPSPERIQNSQLLKFMQACGQSNYKELHDFSIEEPKKFWNSLWDFCEIRGDKCSLEQDRVELGRANQNLADQENMVLETSEFFWKNRFFPKAKINILENLLWQQGSTEALVTIEETGARHAFTWDELRAEVLKTRAALENVGVVAGDRVAAWLPNNSEAVILMLATAGLGAVFISTSPDFGSEGVLDRFGQTAPKVLVACTQYRYGGKVFDCTERLEKIVAGLPSLKKTVVVTNQKNNPTQFISWQDWRNLNISQTKIESFAFNHPLFILFSSGTTGKPKCIVHGAGGLLLNLKKEHLLHCDVHKNDAVMFYTTTGWMMWNWMVFALASGATVVLYDGQPMWPKPNRLWEIAEQEHLSLLGVGAKYLDALAKSDYKPIEHHALIHLRTLCSTGSPLAANRFEFVYKHVKKDVHLASISGGTDICGCFALGNPIGPVYAGELQVPALGMDVDVCDEHGKSLKTSAENEHTRGELVNTHTRGELVCRNPFPNMPIKFWNDPNDTKYKAAYFEKIPGVWAHGDFASWTRHDGLMIHGRSDTTLNPGGVRIGTAEIYRVVEQHPEIMEALVFGQEWQNDVRIVLLVRMVNTHVLEAHKIREIKSSISAACTPRHVPSLILAVPDLPRTRSGKLVELALADAVNGRVVRNTEAILNPEVLFTIAAMPELKNQDKA